MNLNASFFETVLAPLREKLISEKKVGIALSGGPDSMALLHALHAWCQEKGIELAAFHVDHQLRPSSTKEAQLVKTWCQNWKIPLEILAWHPPHIKGSIQESAREARYKLLREATINHHIQTLFLAHHGGDQAETFLMRAFKGSGLFGLAGMPLVAFYEDLTLLRPLLTLQKQDLLHYLKTHDIPSIQDPSNENDNFMRVFIRKEIAAFEEKGLSPAHLMTTTQKLREAKNFILEEAQTFLEKHGYIHEMGYAAFDLSAFSSLHAFLQDVLLELLIRIVGGGAYPPRQNSLKGLLEKCLKKDFKAATLGGCYIVHQKKYLVFYREQEAIEESLMLNPSQKALWDNRFLIDCTGLPKKEGTLKIQKLGEKGRLILASDMASDFSPFLLEGLPSIWHNEALLAVPHFSYGVSGVSAVFSSALLASLPRHFTLKQGVIHE